MWWVVPRSDPISVCWLTGGVHGEVKHTHTDMEREPQIDWVGIPSGLCVFPYDHHDHQLSRPPPPPSLLVYSCILNPSLTANAPTLSIPHIRHLLFHQQVVGLEKGRSHQGAGSCEGYWFMHRPDLLFPSIPTLFLLSAFPCICKGFTLFWHRHVKK